MSSLTDILHVLFVDTSGSPWHAQSFVNARQQEAVMDANQQNLSTLGVRKQLLRIAEISDSNLILKVDTLMCK